jgi:hypothetical protein
MIAGVAESARRRRVRFSTTEFMGHPDKPGDDEKGRESATAPPFARHKS